MIDELTFQSVIYGERKWQRVGERDHVTRSGRHVVLAVWESSCGICGQPFRIETYDGVSQESNCFSVMTCREHRLSPYESMKIWLSKAEDRLAVFEEIRQKKLKLTRSEYRIVDRDRGSRP
jgi:hypothetical protein